MYGGILIVSKNKETSSYMIHSPFIEERKELDNGFSNGWGFHFLPSEEYWIDCHNHLRKGSTVEEIKELLDIWFSHLDAHRLGKVLLISSDANSFEVFNEVSKQDSRFGWIFQMTTDNCDVEIFESALCNGALCLKLHNAPIMRGLAQPDIWLSDNWSEVFSIAAEKGVPVLWHVTQRLSYSPYHGGGANSYWSDGYKKGVKFTNEDLLQIMLEVIKSHPGLKVIGAHQLHIGLKRISQFMDMHDSLYIDTSCGFFVRWGDVIYEEDRKILYEFFVKYKDRILFGSDTGLSTELVDEYSIQAFLGHIRFIRQLRLPYEVLQNIAYKNAEQLFNINKIRVRRDGNVRP